MRRIERHAQEAKQVANEFGHMMSQWQHLFEHQYAYCVKCFLWVVVNRDESYGPARKTRCMK